LSYRRPFRRFLSYDLGDVKAQCFVRDHRGYAWIGSDHGLYRLAFESADLDGPWTIPSPLLDNRVTGVAMDAKGNVYLGTPRGISFVAPNGDTGILTQEGVSWLGTDGLGRLHMATGDGIYRFDAQAWQKIADEQAFAAAFGPDHGRLWVITPDGLIKQVDGDSATTLLDVPARLGVQPRNLVVDSQNTLWFSSSAGLGEIDREGGLVMHVAGDELLDEDVRWVELDVDDTLWMATAKGLARRKNDGQWTRFTVESTQGGLRTMDMQGLHRGADGSLWMATLAGISRRVPESADWSFVDLPGARQLIYDGDDALWVAAVGGLYRISTDTLTPVP
jgi:ligand-binding sensor domain-containing protein